MSVFHECLSEISLLTEERVKNHTEGQSAMAVSKRLRMIIMFVMTLVFFAGCTVRTAEYIRKPTSATRSVTDLGGHSVLLPPSAPDRSNFTPFGYFMISSDPQFTGLLIVYSQSRQVVTYMELYDQAGRLVLIQWIEESGITKTAIDRGFLNSSGSEPVGILGVIVVGTPA